MKTEKNAEEVNRASEVGSFGPSSASFCLNVRAIVSHNHVKQGSELSIGQSSRPTIQSSASPDASRLKTDLNTNTRLLPVGQSGTAGGQKLQEMDGRRSGAARRCLRAQSKYQLQSTFTAQTLGGAEWRLLMRTDHS